MELNELAISCIESDYLRNYLTEKGHVFTSEEQLIIIHNCAKTLDEKLEIYNVYIQKSDDVGKELAKQLVSEITNILGLINNHNYAVIVYKSKHNRYTAIDTLLALQNVVNEGIDDLESDVMTVASLHNGSKLLDIRLNSDLEIIYYKYYLEQAININKYIDIPNDINIGDIVKMHGDSSDTEYIVTSTSLLPNKLKEDSKYLVDVSISVIRKDMLHSHKPYKQQVEDILRKRISRIEGKGQFINSDILYQEHEHFHLTCVEKIS